VWHISVPEEYVNKTFVEVFLHILDKYKMVTIGLYRLPNSKANEYPYVYTNPKPFVRLNSRDKLFVLAH